MEAIASIVQEGQMGGGGGGFERRRATVKIIHRGVVERASSSSRGGKRKSSRRSHDTRLQSHGFSPQFAQRLPLQTDVNGRLDHFIVSLPSPSSPSHSSNR